ncbi:protein PFF0380w [Melanaphis sacchari]|uniref:protein PFF0380w n=1 Tax=Melanaphis sacchari TaxID=742174 RepID=UPI000DC13FC1|nr:protein PFF0380w [Melanaphis sacchari]
MRRRVPSTFVVRAFYVIACTAVAVLGVRGTDDSLRSALEAISDKLGSTSPRVAAAVYLNTDDGQPEDIGYGYQKNLRNYGNIFEQGVRVPNSKIYEDEIAEKFLNYLANESPQYNQKPWSKKSIFREREGSDMPDNLQQLKYDRYSTPSAFRERYKTNPNVEQDYKNNMDNQGDYLYALNTLIDKYIEENVQGMSDEELESFLRAQEEKRNIPEEYQNVYDTYYKRASPMKRQYLFIPRGHMRRNNKYRSKWVKPRLMKRSKKNIALNGSHTDPKVAAELNNIFLGSESNTNTNTTTDINNNVNQTAKPEVDGNNLKIELKKKSIDWSNYFGYDRKKKSIENIPSEDTILNQYMRTYEKENEENEANAINLKDEKLMWLEDTLINNALKYTGANQGTNDPEEINNVKNQVLANLNQAYYIEKLRNENNEMQEKQYEKADFVIPTENNSQPMNSILDIAESNKEADRNECTQLQQITQNCLELGGSAGDLMLPVCTLYRVCSTCESEQSECEDKFIQGSHELCSKAPLCRYFSRRILQLMQEHPLQIQCHKCMVNFLQNED